MDTKQIPFQLFSKYDARKPFFGKNGMLESLQPGTFHLMARLRTGVISVTANVLIESSQETAF